MTPDGPDETAAPAAGPSDDGKIVRSWGLAPPHRGALDRPSVGKT